MDVIAERLKEFRKAKHYNQDGMANAAGMTQRTWGGWEQGAPQALLWLANLARHFNISADFFLCLTDTPVELKTRTLPEGGSELLEYVIDLSDRARSELLAIAKLIYEEDQKWVQYGFGVDAIESTLGSDFVEQLRLRLATLTGELGSERAAIAYIRSCILGEEPPQD